MNDLIAVHPPPPPRGAAMESKVGRPRCATLPQQALANALRPVGRHDTPTASERKSISATCARAKACTWKGDRYEVSTSERPVMPQWSAATPNHSMPRRFQPNVLNADVSCGAMAQPGMLDTTSRTTKAH